MMDGEVGAGRRLDAGEYVSAAAAAAMLNVNMQTFYVYVGRKGLRSQPVPGTRKRRYWRSDVEQLARKPPGNTAPHASSELTLLTSDRLFYRGHDVEQLADTHSVEAVAALLWDVPEQDVFGTPAPPASALVNRMNRMLAGEGGLTRARVLFPLLEADRPSCGLAGADQVHLGLACGGADIIRWLAAFAVNAQAPAAEPLHLFIGRALGVGPQACDLVRRMLVLVCDHGFAPETAAVCAIAGLGVSPWRSVLGGLSVLAGRRVCDGNVAAVRQFITEAASSSDPCALALRRIQDGNALHGFGSDVYKGVDPRVRAVLAQCAIAFPGDRTFMAVQAAMDVIRRAQGKEPNLMLACLLVDRLLGIKESDSLFYVGRAIGWIAHTIEEHGIGAAARPHIYRGQLPLDPKS